MEASDSLAIGVDPLRAAAPRSQRAVWLTAVVSLLRSASLALSGAPRTPLRILCVAALDLAAQTAGRPPLSRERRRSIGSFLDYAAGLNALLDHKPAAARNSAPDETRLGDRGLGALAAEYRRRLTSIECRRPQPGGDANRFLQIQSYRESVVRLALGGAAAITWDAEDLDAGVALVDGDRDLRRAWRLAMLCQLADDLLDYRADLRVGLPSFLTACRSPRQSLALTVDAAESYLRPVAEPPGSGGGPLGLAMRLAGPLLRLLLALSTLRLPTEPSPNGA